MGAAISAVPKTIETVTANPILLLGAIIAGIGTLIGVGISSLIYIIPVLGWIVGYLLTAAVLAAMMGGFLSMVNRGFDGSASLDDLVDGISEHFSSLFGAYLLVMLIFAVVSIGIVTAMVLTVGFSLVSAFEGGDPDSTLLTGAGVAFFAILAIGFLASFLLSLVLQFIDVAVVVGDESATGALGRSWAVFKNGPLSVVGYVIIRLLIGVAVFVPVVVVGAIIALATDGEGSFLIVSLAYVLVFPLVYLVTNAYHVAYFRERVAAGTA